ncbi:MAG: Zn-dependent hydrolase [Myxococcales bacterium]|nr:Zn-dependent hydrolase [Myxococcales bacterium]
MSADLHIDGLRLLAKIEQLGAIGALPGGGVSRLAFTKEDGLGRAQVREWMTELGLAVRMDALGNVIGRRAGEADHLPAVMTGSHIDTVATGGKYDGNLGVLAGLEVIETLNDRGITTLRPLEVGFFSNEEGSRFAPDMMGALVYMGDMSLADACASVDNDGVSVGEALASIDQVGDAQIPGPTPHAFVELHIEQGPILDKERLDIGAVTAVQGISWQRFTFYGVSNHAGTCPMSMRHDAGYVAAEVTRKVRQMTRHSPDSVGTVGVINMHPNLVNVVPNRVEMTVDLRHVDEAELVEAEAVLLAFVAATCEAEGVTFRTDRLARFQPHTFSPAVTGLIAEHAAELGLSHRLMSSGAGHDAQIIGRKCPAGMIFVPSVDGISHNIKEHTEPHHLIAGADVLLRTMVSLANQPAGGTQAGDL